MLHRPWIWMLLAACTVSVSHAQQRLPPVPPVDLNFHPVFGSQDTIPAVATDEVFQQRPTADYRPADLDGPRLLPAESHDVVPVNWLEAFVVYDPEIAIAREQSYLGRPEADPMGEGPPPKKWYDKLSIRGYGQFRINENVHSEPGSAPAHYVGDRSIGDDQSFLIRRARVIISGDVHERLYVYLQPDFASTVPGSNDATYFTQIRDWYGDFYFDPDKVHRLRIGQSKVPFGWENLQSSSNRIPLDRADSLNSAVRNERDLGAFYYWTPMWAQDFFKDVLEEGLKGSGNYGVFGFGVYNGQGGSFLEQNDDLHLVSRFTLPVTFPNAQRMELGIQGYYGKYAVIGSSIDPPGAPGVSRPVGTLDFSNATTIANTEVFRKGWVDRRLAGTFVWYPQPLGFQSEWNVGRGPALNAAQTAIEDRSLTGGYAMVLYKVDWCGTWFPFARYSYFEGGYKSERNAPFVYISEWEFGTEWQITPAAELTLTYLTTDRTNTTPNGLAGSSSYGQFEGDVLRAQFQINY